MAVYVGNWCIYPWFPEHGESYIHTNDLDRFAKLEGNGLFYCAAQEDVYLVLENNVGLFRVRPALARVVPAPKFGFGDLVRVISKPAQPEAVVRAIHWHFDRQQPFYYLFVAEKKVTRRYWAEELEPA